LSNTNLAITSSAPEVLALRIVFPPNKYKYNVQEGYKVKLSLTDFVFKKEIFCKHCFAVNYEEK
jgi:hypothetical protein